MGWIDDQGYQQVPGLKIFLLSPTYERTDDQGYQRVPGFKIFLLSPTYGVNGRPRISAGT